jgi:fructoselysine-6-P-deglycase FrlB-like protein
MSLTSEEIASQPACWREAAALAAESVLALPYAGERVVALGCGTSWFVAQAYAARRAELHWALGVTDAYTPTELPIERPIDRTIVITRSGTTTEALRAIERMQAEATFTTVITAVPDSPAAEMAGHLITLGFADERSVVQTRFATSALALFRAHLGHDLGRTIAEGERALTQPLEPEPTGFDHVVFLGHGWTVGIAEEAALKLREAAQTYSEAYPAMEYRHGPISLAGERSLVWILGSPDPAVAEDVRATGATVRVASLDPMAELVLVHRTAIALAEAKGLDPDHPVHLTRSVVLP